MQYRENILRILQEIVFRVKEIPINDPDVSLFSSDYNVKPDEMANILLQSQNELGFIINTESIDSCQEFSLNKIVNAILKYNINLAN